MLMMPPSRTLAQREPGDRADELCVLAAGKPCVNQRLLGEDPKLSQPACFSPRDIKLLQISKRFAMPEGECLFKYGA
jgi:hypothetical protein